MTVQDDLGQRKIGAARVLARSPQAVSPCLTRTNSPIDRICHSSPDPAVPQQFHLDIMVEDVAAAGPRVLELGAVKLNGENIYADPAGHSFCLIPRPRWAPPIPSDVRALTVGAAT